MMGWASSKVQVSIFHRSCPNNTETRRVTVAPVGCAALAARPLLALARSGQKCEHQQKGPPSAGLEPIRQAPIACLLTPDPSDQSTAARARPNLHIQHHRACPTNGSDRGFARFDPYSLGLTRCREARVVGVFTEATSLSEDRPCCLPCPRSGQRSQSHCRFRSLAPPLTPPLAELSQALELGRLHH